jgi:hypothetical protein
MRKVSPRFRPGMKPAELDDCDRRFFDCEGDLRRRDLPLPTPLPARTNLSQYPACPLGQSLSKASGVSDVGA